MRHGGPTANFVYAFVSNAARFQVCRKHLMNRFHFPSFCCRKHVFDNPGNFIEANLPIKKSGDGNLVGGVQRDGFCPAGLGRFIGQPQTSKFLHVGRVEVQLP